MVLFIFAVALMLILFLGAAAAASGSKHEQAKAEILKATQSIERNPDRRERAQALLNEAVGLYEQVIDAWPDEKAVYRLSSRSLLKAQMATAVATCDEGALASLEAQDIESK